MKVYLAGPAVFFPDAAARVAADKALCVACGLTPLHPIDQPSLRPEDIYHTNLALIDAADGVIADLNPFRGAETDSGTAFEVGYAVALGKPVVGYLHRPMTVLERVKGLGFPIQFDTQAQLWRDRDGNLIEDFGLGANLMLAVPCPIVVGGVAEALQALKDRLTGVPPSRVCPDHRTASVTSDTLAANQGLSKLSFQVC